MKVRIFFLLCFSISLYGDSSKSYYFINVPYGTFLQEQMDRESIFIPSFSRIEMLAETTRDSNIQGYNDTYKKIIFKKRIGYVPSKSIGTFNIIKRKESPDKSKYFEIISPYQGCDCNMYAGYNHSCFMEISSARTSELIKRIGNDKQKPCPSHYWRRTVDWFNEKDLLVMGFSDGDGGSGGSWGSSFEKVNWYSGKIENLYSMQQLNCLDSEAKDGYSILFQLASSGKFHLHWAGKLYSISNSMIKYDKFKYNEEFSAYDCKLDLKKAKPIIGNSVIIYKDSLNKIFYEISGAFRFYYKGKEIFLN